MSKEELAGGASLDAVRPWGWLQSLLRSVFSRRARAPEWEIAENPKREWFPMQGGELSNALYHAVRVKGGITERRRLTSKELADHEAYVDLKDFQSW